MQLQTQILIEASPKQVWETLTKVQNYPNWNPFIKRFDGNLSVGQKVAVTIHPPQSSPMTFRPVITVLEKEKILEWQGKLYFSGLFDGNHRFELLDLGNGNTLFKHEERFSGLLVRFIDLSKTEQGFHLMNQQLKQVVESSALVDSHPQPTSIV